MEIICLMIKSLVEKKIISLQDDDYKTELQSLLIRWIGILPEARALYFGTKQLGLEEDLSSLEIGDDEHETASDDGETDAKNGKSKSKKKQKSKTNSNNDNKKVRVGVDNAGLNNTLVLEDSIGVAESKPYLKELEFSLDETLEKFSDDNFDSNTGNIGGGLLKDSFFLQQIKIVVREISRQDKVPEVNKINRFGNGFSRM